MSDLDEHLRSVGRRLVDGLDEDPPSVQVSADGIVSVTVSPTLQITSLTLGDIDLPLEDRARLEQALTTAVNEAIGEIIGAHRARFAALVSAPPRDRE